MKALIAAVALLWVARPELAQTPLEKARDLYAGAAYEDALGALDRMTQSGTLAADTAVTVDEYRAFCLFALGRTAEAEAVAESIVRRNPLVDLDDRDISPPIEAMFAAVRKRVLPQAIRDEYHSARSLVVAKSPDATAHLDHVDALLRKAQALGVWDDTLADVRTLVDGFLELSRAAESLQATSRAQGAAAATSAGAAVETRGTGGAPARSAAKPPAIQPPVAIVQAMPRAPAALLDILRSAHNPGVYEVMIDQAGAVRDVKVQQSLNPEYDNLVMMASRSWHYRPATKDGVRIESVKTLVVDPGKLQ